MKSLFGIVAFLLLFFTSPFLTQGQQQKPENAIPVVTGYTSFVTTFISGERVLKPSITPILLIPAGKRWLLEGEFEYEGEFERHPDGEWHRDYERNIEYLQVDFLANRYLTVVGGRFLTPFGIVNERLHPMWILNIPVFPLISPMEMGSGNGFQLRGGARVASGVNVNYAGYFSALTATRTLEADRHAGGRWSLFFPNQRLEFGASFQRMLQEERTNSFGFDATWQPKAVPFDFRSEYARSSLGSGYWVEGAYRLRRVPVMKPFFRKSQVAVRVEQFFAPALNEGMGAEGAKKEAHGELPDVNTQRVLVGWSYYFRDGLKLGLSYGREFSAMGDRNVWAIGLGYRWLF